MEWQTNGSPRAVKTYKNLELIPSTRIKSLLELTIKREVLRWLIAAKSRHGHFAVYHKRYQHIEKTDTHCMCRQKTSAAASI